MAFVCLLLCDELDTLHFLTRVLDEARIEREICTDYSSARQLVRQKKFDCLIVDCDGIEGAGKFMKELRRAGSNRYAILMALTGEQTGMAEAYELGANFVIDKPLLAEVLVRSLRAAEGFMLREQRRSYRHPVDFLVTLQRGKAPAAYFNCRNLSEGGMCLKNALVLQPGETVGLEFQVAGSFPVQGTGEVLWKGSAGTGLKFLQISKSGRAKLREWLGEQFDLQSANMFNPVAPNAGGAKTRLP